MSRMCDSCGSVPFYTLLHFNLLYRFQFRVACPHPEPDILIQELGPVHVMRAVAGEVQADDAVKDVQ